MSRSLATSVARLREDTAFDERRRAALVATTRSLAGLYDYAVTDETQSLYVVNQLARTLLDALDRLDGLVLETGGDAIDKLLADLAATTPVDTPHP